MNIEMRELVVRDQLEGFWTSIGHLVIDTDADPDHDNPLFGVSDWFRHPSAPTGYAIELSTNTIVNQTAHLDDEGFAAYVDVLEWVANKAFMAIRHEDRPDPILQLMDVAFAAFRHWNDVQAHALDAMAAG